MITLDTDREREIFDKAFFTGCDMVFQMYFDSLKNEEFNSLWKMACDAFKNRVKESVQ